MFVRVKSLDAYPRFSFANSNASDAIPCQKCHEMRVVGNKHSVFSSKLQILKMARVLGTPKVPLPSLPNFEIQNASAAPTFAQAPPLYL